MFKRCFFIVLLLLAATQLVPAHDTWIGKRDGELLVLHGHGDKIDPYDASRVKDAKAVDAKGQAVAMEIVRKKENASLSPKGDPAIVGALYNSGYWLKTTDGWKQETKRQGKGKYTIVESYKSEHWCKSFLAPSSASCKPLGLRFEIVPQKDPTTLSAGDKLAIKVLLDGKPVEGAVITTPSALVSEKKDPLKTDKAGAATATIRKSGSQMIKAKLRIPFKGDPDADMLSFSSTMTFKIH